MARESKRKREERRFGKPERLADRLVASCAPPNYIRPEDVPEWTKDCTVVRMALESIPLIEASNVATYAFDHLDTIEHWDTMPACRPPFGLTWVEATGGWACLPEVMSFGSLFSPCSHQKAVHFAQGRRTQEEWERTSLFRICTTSVQLKGTLYPVFPVMKCLLFYGADGCFAAEPVYSLCYGKGANIPFLKQIGAVGIGMVNATILALAFMNCSNVKTTVHNPDAGLNRERKKNGLKPFLRYHTIDIEPMKQVIRTEGDIESNGLRKALHIVRGHFAHYTDDRPLFGKYAGTFWVPSHVKGTIKEGMVVSDYRVHAPKPSETLSEKS